jgi:dTDP-4-dehydrorhamnose reductase
LTVLVFGAGGQLGRALLGAGAADLPAVGVGHGEADIADIDAVRAAIARRGVSVVVNAAAYTDVDRAEDEPEKARRANTTGPGVLASVCAERGLPLIHVSTDYVFDGARGSAYVESDPIGPLSVYGRTKAAGEEAVRETLDNHLILRTSWLYGSGGRNFVTTILRLAAEKETIRVVADQRGSPTAVADLATAIAVAVRAIGRGEGIWGTFHVAGGGSASRYELASAVLEAQARFTGRRPVIEKATSAAFPTRATRPANSALDSGRFAAAYGFRAADWRSAVESAVAASFGVGAGR